jgi:transposase
LPDLRAERTDAGAAVSLQLEDVGRDSGRNLVELLLPGTIRSPQIIEFLSYLLRHISGKVLIVWDGLPGHRSRAVWDFVQQQKGLLWLESLPAYAPELNPVEYLWSHWKQHELPNFCPQNFGQLSSYARKALRRMRKRPTLVIVFWRQAELFPA